MADHDEDEDDPHAGTINLDDEAERRGRTRGPYEAAGLLMSERRFVETAEGRIYEYDRAKGFWVYRTAAFLRAAVHGIRPKFSAHQFIETVGYVARANHDSALEWGRVSPSEVAVTNGVLDLVTMVLRPHDADDWLDYVVPHAWAPIWLGAVDSWLGIETDAAAALQEFFGYVLMNHARFKRALVCLGEPDSGKSRIPATLKTLIGAAAHCSIGVADMDDPRRLAHILHKRVNTITELSADAMIKDGGFKTLVGTEEPLLIDVKHGPILTYTPICKHVIACNTLPQVNDKTSATFDRLLIIPFNNVLPKQDQDRDLDDKIEAEMEGVLAWAVEGARRLHLAGGLFTAVPEAESIVARERSYSNPMHAFIAEELVADPVQAVAISQIVERYNVCKFGKPVHSRLVATWLRSALGRDCTKVVRFGDRSAMALLGYRLHGLSLGSQPAEPGDW